MADKIITWLLTAGGYGITLFLIRRWIVQLEKTVERYIRGHQECRETLPLRFVSRQDNKGDHDKIWIKLDSLEKDVSYAKGLRNGRG
jgi:hypothetical protein